MVLYLSFCSLCFSSLGVISARSLGAVNPSLRSTVKREHFFTHVYFSNETVSQSNVWTGPMKMFHLEHETMNVCQRIVARFVHVECRFDKIEDIFQVFGSLVLLRLQKDGGDFGQTYCTGTQAAQVLLVRSYYLCEHSACEM